MKIYSLSNLVVYCFMIVVGTLGPVHLLHLRAQTFQATNTSPVIGAGAAQVPGDALIQDGGHLTIEPAVIIKSADGAEDAGLMEIILEGGELIPLGLTNALVFFTSSAEAPKAGGGYDLRPRPGVDTLHHGSLQYATDLHASKNFPQLSN